MWIKIIAVVLGYFGVIALLLGFMLNASPRKEPGTMPGRKIGLIGLIALLVGAGVAIFSPPAAAQVQLAPGESVRICATLGSHTGGGVVCRHNVRLGRIEMNYLGPSHWKSFWGAGTAASVLPALCRETGARVVYEVIPRSVGYRLRSISCATGRSGPWVLSEVNIQAQQEICAEVKSRSLGRISCSFNGDLGLLHFRDSGALRMTNWSGQHDDLLAALCEEANLVQETLPNGTIKTHRCHEE